jgi:two-component system sensor histidine kinase MprB
VRRRRSIRTRLTLIATLAVTTVALLVGVLAWLALHQALMHQVDQELQTMSQGPIRYLDQDAIAALPFNPLTPPTGIQIQVVFPDGHTIGPEGTLRLPIEAADRAVIAGRTSQANYTVDTDHGRFRVLTIRGAHGQTIQLGRSLADADATLQNAGILMAVLAAVAAAAAGLAGRLVASTGLRPVYKLTVAATNIAATRDLAHPIPVDGHDEVALLGQAFNQMLSALDQSQQAQRELIEDAAHELRTPMSSMRTNVELLIHAGADLSPTDRQALLSDLHKQSIELSNLVTDLVDLSRFKAIAEPAEPVDLAGLAADAIDRARIRYPQARLAQHGEPSITVTAQPAALGRAVLNLLDNAAKFGPPEQTIEVHVGTVGNDSTRFAEIGVADRAPAIPDTERERIFQRFHRLDTARAVPGSGLGLAIVHQTVTAHHGTITVEPRPDGGNTFRLRLPLTPATAASRACQSGGQRVRSGQPPDRT